jgi:hypothetical protein
MRKMEIHRLIYYSLLSLFHSFCSSQIHSAETHTKIIKFNFFSNNITLAVPSSERLSERSLAAAANHTQENISNDDNKTLSHFEI